MMKGKAKDIDEYLAALSTDKQAALRKLRKTIKAMVPKAEEYITYGLPAFRMNGRPLVAFGAGASHCAFYPMSASTVEAHKADLEAFETSKGHDPLPTGQAPACRPREKAGQGADRGERAVRVRPAFAQAGGFTSTARL